MPDNLLWCHDCHKDADEKCEQGDHLVNKKQYCSVCGQIFGYCSCGEFGERL